MLLVVFAFIRLWKESLFGEGVDWRRNVVGAVLPLHDRPCGRVVQADLIHVLVVLCKGQTIRELVELQVRREVQFREVGNTLPKTRPQRRDLGLLLVLVKARLGKNFAQLILQLFPLFHFLCCSRIIFGRLWILQYKCASVENYC